MRITNAWVLTVVLFGSAPLWGQDPKDANPPTQTTTAAPNADTPGASAPDPDSLAPTTPVIPGVPGPLDYPRVGEGDSPIPPNCVPQHFWFHADYILWFMRSDKTIPLIDTIPFSPSSTFDYSSATTLFPKGNEVGHNPLSGLRIDTGAWFDNSHQFGIDVSAFGTEQNSKGAFYASDAAGAPILARFYSNANSGVPTALLFSNPDPLMGYTGSVGATSRIAQIYNGDISLRWNGYRVFSDNSDYLFGVRYFHFNEQINIFSNASLRDGTQLAVSRPLRGRK